MKRVLLTVAGLALLAATGCAGMGSPIPGGLYADVKTPRDAETGPGATKVGIATCESILGWIAVGDCSIATAKQNGQINTIQSVDYDVKNILNVYATYTTRVRGN